mgnify:CR=1 FL=1
MPHHIVIIEDEPVTQARLQSYFTQEGYTVSVTASGAGLREIMQNQPVDLILLDINLPDENGLMLTRALRERSTVGIILVTRRLRHQTAGTARTGSTGEKSALANRPRATSSTAHSGQLLSLCRLLPECVAPYAGAGWRAD